LAVLVALAWANSPWGDAYRQLWEAELRLGVPAVGLALDLRGWINEGLMTLFFFVAGLEIKRELVDGELREPRRAALPVFAAVGGVIVPALLFLAVNWGGPGQHGWGVPIATDIAMAIGVLALLGRRVNASIRLFVLTLAIADDIGAIFVIAVFYSSGIHTWSLALAVAIVGLIVLMQRLNVASITLYCLPGVVLWWATHHSGVHATISGVVLGLLTPATARESREPAHGEVPTQRERPALGPAAGDHRSASVVEMLECRLHPLTSRVILPLFALANAGVELSGQNIRTAAGSAVTAGVVLGLVLGKPVGITLFAWLAWRSGAADLPTNVSWHELLGAGCIAGVGFTVSMFVAGLAFPDVALEDQAKLGILVASFAASLLGTAVLIRSRKSDERQMSPRG
jgi:NhaA family Na+:H+ antiporter